MRKKLKKSLNAKVFLWVFAALTLCSVVIYSIVIIVIPQRYQITGDEQFKKNVDLLFSELKNKNYEEATEQIYNFCIENHAVAMLSNDNEVSVAFGDIESVDEDLPTATSTFLADIELRGESTVYTLSVTSISKTANEIFNLLLQFISVILAVIVILSILSAFICSKVIVAPIAEISRISKRMTELDMTWRCSAERSDEIGVLSSSLNTMAVRLQSAMSDLETANQKLKADVRKFQKLEEQHRDFFAAVSHELKTPLTILRGQIENMILGYGDYQNHEKYLPQALKTTEDIEYLVKEILSITKMESMDISSTLEDVSLSEMARGLVFDMKLLAADKNLNIYQDIPVEITVSVNKNLFHKALSNIIGNAIRHSGVGAEIYISYESGKNTFIVENTGVFLPQESLENMFTPFYRADKSRNKTTGGSGLGLYIVKTILDLHGMGYHIDNTDKGVAFYLQFYS